MNKNSYFFGQSVFGQLISLIDNTKIKTVVKKHNSDYYVKKFDTSDHLISMLFSTFAHCTSLREIAASMLGLKGKMSHFQLKKIPYKSTLSDANEVTWYSKIFIILYSKNFILLSRTADNHMLGRTD